MARLAFCDYHNMIAILEKYELNQDFHQIVDFVKASHIRIEKTEEGTKILATVDGKFRTISESSIMRNLNLNDEAGICSLPNAELFENLTLMGYNISPNQKRARIAQSSALPPVEDELASPIRDDSQEMASKIEAQEFEIINLKARVKLLEDREGGGIAHSGYDSLIKGRSLDEGKEAAEKGSDDTEEMVTVLTSLDAATILSSGVAEVPTGSGSIPTASPPATGVPTGSEVVPTASPIFTTATKSTPYTRRKGKEKMVESDTPTKKKLQEQIDVQVARELEEMMIDGLDRNNETVAKYLQEYHQFATELPIGRRIELINDLVKYQDNYAKVLKFQTQQRKPLSRKQQRDFYMSVLKSQSGWKDSTQKVKITEEVYEEKLKEIMELIPDEEVYVEALQVKHPIIDWEVHTKGERMKESLSIRPATSDKEIELWVDLKRLYEPDIEDQLWTHTQNMMHALVEWKLYETCGVHHVISKDQEMFMLVEKDYPLRKGIPTVSEGFPLPKEVPTASKESSPADDKRCHCQKDCTAIEDRGIDTNGRPRRQETIGGTSTQTRSERVLEQPNEPPLIEGHTSGSGEGRLEENIKLTDTVPTPYDLPLTGGYTPGSDAGGPSVHIEDSPKQVRIIDEMDKDENINLVSQQGEVKQTAEHSKGNDDETLAETLLNIKRSSAKDKGKGIMQEPELPKNLKKKEMIPLSLDEELAQKLYAEELAKEEERQKQERYNSEKLWKETNEEAKAQGDSDQEVEELKLYKRIILKDDIAIEAIPLAIKPLVITKYKIVKEGKISNYHITRADGSTRRYTSMINLLENIDREDLETVWKLVKDKYGNIRPEEGYEIVL
uniref:Uncharacterized protein n=1 Tax=Tanacetum cinerariifolium TaxID=118510 RepID=A0A6L2JW98_TANCI|nr:hypothetical protein [Tanacetum cinerariifolium]